MDLQEEISIASESHRQEIKTLNQYPVDQLQYRLNQLERKWREIYQNITAKHFKNELQEKE